MVICASDGADLPITRGLVNSTYPDSQRQGLASTASNVRRRSAPRARAPGSRRCRRSDCSRRSRARERFDEPRASSSLTRAVDVVLLPGARARRDRTTARSIRARSMAVALRAGSRAALLLGLSPRWQPPPPGAAAPFTPTPVGALQVPDLRASRSPVDRVGLRGRASTRSAAASMHEPTSPSRQRKAQHFVPAVARLLVAWPAARRPADVALCGPGGEHGHRRVDPVTADQHLGHRRGRRCAQHQQPAPGPDGRQDVLDRRRTEQPDGASARFLDRLDRRSPPGRRDGRRPR